jgi:hypothetical protein
MGLESFTNALNGPQPKLIYSEVVIAIFFDDPSARTTFLRDEKERTPPPPHAHTGFVCARDLRAI